MHNNGTRVNLDPQMRTYQARLNNSKMYIHNNALYYFRFDFAPRLLLLKGGEVDTTDLEPNYIPFHYATPRARVLATPEATRRIERFRPLLLQFLRDRGSSGLLLLLSH